MSERFSFRNLVAVELEITAANYSWPEDELELFFGWFRWLFAWFRGFDDDEVDAYCCTRVQTRCVTPDAVEVLIRSARVRLYDLAFFASEACRFCVIGCPLLDAHIRRNGLRGYLTAITLVNGLMVGVPPEFVLWAPGIYGRDFAKKAREFWFRPVTLRELVHARAPFVVYMMGMASIVRGLDSCWREGAWTGLFCVDRARVAELREFLLKLRKEETIHYAVSPDSVETLPLICEEQILKLLQDLSNTPVDLLCAE